MGTSSSSKQQKQHELKCNEYLREANRLHDLKQYDQALLFYDKALKQGHSQMALCHKNKGLTLYSLNRLEEALDAYAKSIQLNPRESNTHYCRAIALHKLKKYTESLRSYDQAIEIDPKNADAWKVRKNSLILLG